jgi:hypothetical protein
VFKTSLWHVVKPCLKKKEKEKENTVQQQALPKRNKIVKDILQRKMTLQKSSR